MSNLPSAFKSPKGEAEYLAAYEATMRLWPVPYEPMGIPSLFGSTHVVVCGPKNAPPPVLLHCFMTSLTVWAYNIADFSRDHRVYALDMMGQPGKSIPDQHIRNREEMAEWLSSILDALGISQTDLAGYLYGGFAALNYAIRTPYRLRKLVLLTPIGSFVPLRTQFFIRGMLTRLPGRFWTNSMMVCCCWAPFLLSIVCSPSRCPSRPGRVPASPFFGHGRPAVWCGRTAAGAGRVSDREDSARELCHLADARRCTRVLR
jgi:pimeloyl-ACP methyl ester carboxylesterase